MPRFQDKPSPQQSRWGLVVALYAAGGFAACAPKVSDTPPKVAPQFDTVPAAVDAPWRVEASERRTQDLPTQSRPVLLKNARLLLGDGREIPSGHIAFANGRITSVGTGPGTPEANATVIDAGGKFVTPGLIDTHSHIGVYPLPHVNAHSDGNEATSPVTPDVRTIDAVWPQDPAIARAIAGGVTTIQVLPGSANLVGGRAVTLKLRRAVSARDMVFEAAPGGLKMACGENPKRVYGGRKSAPSTRMGNLAGQRSAFLAARRLIDEWDQFRKEDQKERSEDAKERAIEKAEQEQRKLREAWCSKVRSHTSQKRCAAWRRTWSEASDETSEPKSPKLPPARDLAKETLAAALEGRILVHVHCYRADDMARILALGDEVGFSVRSFHHALEAYKIRKELARRKIAVSTWADWWGFKVEAYDGIPENIALLSQAQAMPVVHSDSVEGIQRLNQEAAKALWAGRHAGIPIDTGKAIEWVTKNPAWALGIDARVGTLAKGKDADVVLWSADPLSVYSTAERVYIDGVLRFERGAAPDSDFEVSQ